MYYIFITIWARTWHVNGSAYKFTIAIFFKKNIGGIILDYIIFIISLNMYNLNKMYENSHLSLGAIDSNIILHGSVYLLFLNKL